MEKRLYRSNINKTMCGVMGGLGEYFDVDPTIIRLAYVLFAFITGILPGIFLYFIMALIVPKKA